MSDFYDRISRRAKGRDLSKFRSIDEWYKHRDSVRADQFDGATYERAIGKSEELEKLTQARGEENWWDLVRDEFLSFYKASPVMREHQEMRPSHAINRSVINRVMDLTEHEELRDYTALDVWASTMAALQFGMKLQNILDQSKELQDLQKDADKLQEDFDKLLDSLDQTLDDMSDEDLDQALDDLEQLMGESEVIQEAADAAAVAARSELRDGMGEVSEAIEGTQELIQFGADPGKPHQLSGERRQALAERISGSQKLVELAKMVGRFKAFALSTHATKVKTGADEVYSVTFGRDLQRVLPTELMTLVDPDMEMLFYKKLVSGKLFQYDLRGKEKVAQGAIICMVDNSGSMHGMRELWAKAVALALLEIARIEKRDFYGIHFGGPRDEPVEFFFEKGYGEPEKVLDFAEFFLGGGTDFELPIGRAVEVLERQFNDEGAMKGDLVMITDGECQVGKDWMDRYENAKESLDFRMFGCLIGGYPTVLKSLSDAVYTIRELVYGNDAEGVFNLI